MGLLAEWIHSWVRAFGPLAGVLVVGVVRLRQRVLWLVSALALSALSACSTTTTNNISPDQSIAQIEPLSAWIGMPEAGRTSPHFSLWTPSSNYAIASISPDIKQADPATSCPPPRHDGETAHLYRQVLPAGGTIKRIGPEASVIVQSGTITGTVVGPTYPEDLPLFSSSETIAARLEAQTDKTDLEVAEICLLQDDQNTAFNEQLPYLFGAVLYAPVWYGLDALGAFDQDDRLASHGLPDIAQLDLGTHVEPSHLEALASVRHFWLNTDLSIGDIRVLVIGIEAPSANVSEGEARRQTITLGFEVGQLVWKSAAWQTGRELCAQLPKAERKEHCSRILGHHYLKFPDYPGTALNE